MKRRVMCLLLAGVALMGLWVPAYAQEGQEDPAAETEVPIAEPEVPAAETFAEPEVPAAVPAEPVPAAEDGILTVLPQSGGQDGVMPAKAPATSGKCGSNLKWKISTDGTLTISGKGAMYNYDGKVVSLAGVVVTTAPWSDYDCSSGIKRIVVENGVTSIGACAFWGSSATSASIADSVTSIGANAFADCMILTSVNLPKNLKSLEDGVFWRCWDLVSLTIPATVQSLGYSAIISDALRQVTVLNPACTFKPNSLNGIKGRLCVNGYSGSTAEAYARKNGFLFSAINLDTPRLQKLEAVSGGVKLSWGAISGAVKYRVCYRTANGDWKKLKDTTGTSYTWSGAKTGTAYYFTVRCVDKTGRYFMSDYDPVGVSFIRCATPKISRAAANAGGAIELSWGAVKGAGLYRVFLKNSKAPGGWETYQDVAGTSCVYPNAVSGKKYTFTVRCIDGAGNYISSYDGKGKSVTYIAPPSVKSVESAASGIKISWDKVGGAAKYRVCYRTEGGAWKKLADTTGSSYTWKNAKKNTKYYFTVRCVSSNGKSFTSGFYEDPNDTFTLLATPSVRVTNAAGGVTVSWGAVKGAAQYYVFMKKNGTWERIGQTGGTSFTCTAVTSGTKYTFTVRCADGSGRYASGYSTGGKSVTYLSAPNVRVENASKGIKISWDKVKGAAMYRVFYLNSAGQWKKLADTTKTSYTWTKAQAGQSYTFTVRCVNSSGKSYTSAYDPAGRTITFVK